jgi:hypothetical protein
MVSFAQFEREVTGERIRHKIAASKKKGRNCPALSSGLCESEAGDQLDGGGHQGLDEVPALFSGG